MRILKREEAEAFSSSPDIFDRAVIFAKMSLCHKSHRGAVVFRDNKILGEGYNAPLGDFRCDGQSYHPICGQFAIHAEQDAIYNALEAGHSLKRASIFHLKVRDFRYTTFSKGPSCIECSKLAVRMRMNELILWQEEGLVAYSVEEFHRLTIENLLNQKK